MRTKALRRTAVPFVWYPPILAAVSGRLTNPSQFRGVSTGQAFGPVSQSFSPLPQGG